MGEEGAALSGLKLAMDGFTYLAIIFLGSFLELYAACAACSLRNTWDDCKDDYAWAVAAGVISIVFVLVLGVFQKFVPALGNGIVGHILVGLLCALWFCGMAVCTMEEPFAVGGNGFFGTWGRW